ncbi:hypothetical protein PRZ48_011918 [Zasmidium cellare]|uniref:Uncharacterized protein n=1 Tax=Zasmidium cellare TaxID=395010 RepID=A0ABR0E7R5_ZASCE|nr:hypothetical protein PRZ48_011918 [Zasmidium cellare]
MASEPEPLAIEAFNKMPSIQKGASVDSHDKALSMESRKPSSDSKPARSYGVVVTEYVVLQHIHDPDTQPGIQKHSQYCAAFRNEVDAVDYIKRLVSQDVDHVRSPSPITDLTSEIEPPRSYRTIDDFLEGKEALDTIYSGGKYIGLGYHYREGTVGWERMIWIQESRGIAY